MTTGRDKRQQKGYMYINYVCLLHKSPYQQRSPHLLENNSGPSELQLSLLLQHQQLTLYLSCTKIHREPISTNQLDAVGSGFQ